MYLPGSLQLKSFEIFSATKAPFWASSQPRETKLLELPTEPTSASLYPFWNRDNKSQYLNAWSF